MFDFFKVSHENEEEEPENDHAQGSRLFRSTRKNYQLGATIDRKTRGLSMNKNRKTLVDKVSTQEKEASKTSILQPSVPKTAQNIPNKPNFVSPVQKRILSKQLLSQIHLCRFLFKSISNIDGISYEFSPETRDELLLIMFYKLWETKNLKLVDE